MSGANLEGGQTHRANRRVRPGVGWPRWSAVGRGRCVLARVVVAVVVMVGVLVGVGASPALAVPVATTRAPLPGSQFQGGDGEQANAAGLIDWQGFEADGRVTHTSDPNADDNIFSGGSKELEPGGWGLTTQNGGSNPSKGNILDFYSAFDHPKGGDGFLYLAFTREASNGDVFVTFELNQNARLWRNSSGALIPCRTTGDILIGFQGVTPTVEVYRWVTDTADAATGCALTGHLVSASGLTPNVDVQGSLNNAGAITNYLPGFYAATIPQGKFGEVAINLSRVLGDLNGGDRCGVFASAWMHSRASHSESSQMEDYVAPQGLSVRTCKASPALSTVASGLVKHNARGRLHARRYALLGGVISDTALLSDGVGPPTGTITFRLFGPDEPTCSGSPVFSSKATVLGNGYYQSGEYSPTAVGTYRWVVDYSGDQSNQPAGPTACDDEPTDVLPASPSLSSSASAGLRHGLGRATVRAARAPRPISDTATLEGGFSPTGLITFRLYGPDDATCSRDHIFASSVPVHGNGPYTSDPFTPTSPGTYRWVVSYSGDANNDPAGPTACDDPAEAVVISPAQPALTTQASGAVPIGGAIHDTAHLSGGTEPTGTITFHAYGPDNNTCAGDPIFTSTATVSGNGSYDSQPFTPGAAGTYRWVVSYSGDTNNAAAGPTGCGDPAEAVVVAPTPDLTHPDLASTASAGTPAGSQIHDTAHLSGGTDPTGTITFHVYGPNDGSCADVPAATSTVTVSGNGDYQSEPFTPTRAGTYHWVARYSGDEHNHPAGPTACGDAAETVVVTKATPGLRTHASGEVSIGGAVWDGALLSGGSRPTGTITFRLYGPNDAACKAAPPFTAKATVVGNGAYRSPDFTPQHVGLYRWVATYSGDTDNAAAGPTGCGEHGETVIVRPRHPLLSTSASPPATLTRARRARAAGLTIYDSATLRGGFAPTGHVTFELFGPDNATCSGTPVFTSAIVVMGNGIYNSERFTPTASGTYRWQATYSGDAHNRPTGPTSCDDQAEAVSVTVPAAPTLTTSASAAVPLGGAIHDTAHLSGGTLPTGTITFRLYGPGKTDCTGDPLFTSTVRVVGNNDYASEPFTPTTPGAYQWIAGYSGDATNQPAGPTACTDSTETAIVAPPGITTPVLPAFSTTTSQSPTLGGPLYDTATLSGGTAPGGTITFELFGPDNATCTGAPAFTTTTPVNGNGSYRSAEFIVGASGTYRWVATYSGDAMNTPAGPTTCGDSTETATISANPGPVPPAGPNEPAPPKPKPLPPPKAKPPTPKPKPPKPKPPSSPPPVTG